MIHLRDAWRDFIPFMQFKNVKNTHGGVLFSVKLQALAFNSTESKTSPWVFFVFLIVQIVPNRANVSHMLFFSHGLIHQTRRYVIKLFHWIPGLEAPQIRMVLFTMIFLINSWSANFTKWSNTTKKFASGCPQIVWVCLTIFWDWRLKA